MKYCHLIVGLLTAALGSARGLADCPTGAAPRLLPVPNYVSGYSAGPSRLSVDETTLVTQYRSSANQLQIFRSGSGGWTLDRTVTINNVVQGFAVSGDILAVAIPASTGTPSSSCSAHLYRRDAITGDWNYFSDYPFWFSESASIALSANNIVVAWPPSLSGWPLLCKAYTISAAGAVTFAGTLDVSDPALGPKGGGFGASMSMDGNMLAVGAPYDNQAGPYIGAVYIYRLENEAWTLFQKIVPAGPSPTPGFGMAVALHNGRLAVGSVHSARGVGDPNPIDNRGGFVEVYELGGSAFTLAAHLTNPHSDSTVPAAFGSAVAIRNNRLLVGAYLDTYSGVSSGAGYVFDYSNGAWTTSGVMALNASAGSWLGVQVGLAGTSAFAVAPFYNEGRLACAVFDSCALPEGGTGPRCLPGVGGLFTYIMRWFQGDPWADFNNDGVLAVQDLMDYLNAWFAGC